MGQWDQSRADIPRERGYYPGIADSVRVSAPFVPATGNRPGGYQLPVIGLVVVIGVLFFLHGAGKKFI